jgi:dienelactone hydrolase
MDDHSIWGWLKKPFQVIYVASIAIPHVYYNSFPKSWPRVTSWFHALRGSEEGKKYPIGAAGFCWGGKHTINLAHGLRSPSNEFLIDAAFTAHPSNLEMPGEIEKVRLPLAIAQPEKDMALKPEQYALIKEKLGVLAKDQGIKWECVEYEGATHGFSVRADESKNEGKQAVEAEEQAVKWFQMQFATVKR